MNSNEDNFLCCCEYYDRDDQVNHLLGCCCNCQDFDEGMDSLISGKGFPQKNRKSCLSTLEDRLRIPWIGGARKITIHFLFSAIIIPFSFYISCSGIIETAVCMSVLSVIPFIVRCRTDRVSTITSFFNAWLLVSFLVLYLIFQFVVIPFLEILTEENLLLTIFIFASCFCFWRCSKQNCFDTATVLCPHCQINVPRGSRHSLWLGYCIGSHNIEYYLLGLVLTVISLLYGCDLTLTTVCHPFTWFWAIMLPDDCSLVYDITEVALSFVSAVYGLILAAFFFLLLIRKLVFLACMRCRKGNVDHNVHEHKELLI